MSTIWSWLHPEVCSLANWPYQLGHRHLMSRETFGIQSDRPINVGFKLSSWWVLHHPLPSNTHISQSRRPMLAYHARPWPRTHDRGLWHLEHYKDFWWFNGRIRRPLYQSVLDIWGVRVEQISINLQTLQMPQQLKTVSMSSSLAISHLVPSYCFQWRKRLRYLQVQHQQGVVISLYRGWRILLGEELRRHSALQLSFYFQFAIEPWLYQEDAQ